jgi:hypothetical protein
MNSPSMGAGARFLALELFICKGAPRKDCLGAVRVHGPAPGVRKTTRWWPTARNFTCQAIAPLLAPRTTKTTNQQQSQVDSQRPYPATGGRRVQDEKSPKQRKLHGPVFTQKSRHMEHSSLAHPRFHRRHDKNGRFRALATAPGLGEPAERGIERLRNDLYLLELRGF